MEACIAALAGNAEIAISAGTVAETLIVATGRGIAEEAARLIDDLGLEIVPVSPASARRVRDAYAAWGKGLHPAALNFGDCFSYELAKRRACPLLYVGNGFARTDLKSAV